MCSVVLINGSPNGKKGNTEVFIRRFMQGMGCECDVQYTSGAKPAELAGAVAAYDDILVFMPLYVHGMPGSVMKLFEQLATAKPGQRLGVVEQHGFIEAAHADYLKGYMAILAEKLGYEYIGMVVNGGAAGTRFMPERMNKKLFEQLETLGSHYAKTGEWHQPTMQLLAEPYKLSAGKVRFYKLATKLGITNMFWHSMMKQENGFDTRFDQPFLRKH